MGRLEFNADGTPKDYEKFSPKIIRYALNNAQIEAVNTLDGNLLILASAGTGKTTTIVERYLNLVRNHNFDPDSILMTTFTRKAAEDMKKKILSKTKKISSWIGTMHSLFLRILRENSERLFSNSNFSIIVESSKKKRIIRRILSEEKIEASRDVVDYFLDRIERFKNVGILAEFLTDEEYFGEEGEIEHLKEDRFVKIDSQLKTQSIKIYKKYQEFLRKENNIDLDDILLLTYDLFEKNKDVLNKYSEKFKIIMVDEAQDLNVVQIKILNLLENNNLCLIGDDCQNIYSWRGASNKLVFDFDESHKKIVLKENYRSNENIICAVNKIIDSIQFKIDKKLKGTRDKGTDIIIQSFDSFESEMDFIVSEVSSFLKKGAKMEDIAVLVRTNFLGKKLERAFIKNKIPCHLSRSLNFLDREEIHDVLSFLRVKVNIKSRIDFERIFNLIEGFGDAKVKKILDFLKEKDYVLTDVLNNLSELKLNDLDSRNVHNLFALIADYSKHPIDSFLDFFDYLGRIAKRYFRDPDRIEDKEKNLELLKELFNDRDYTLDSVRDFLYELIDLNRKDTDVDKVTLSTIHSAKGLEWKYVFLAGCNEKILPLYQKSLEKLKKDDELRLFYVAVSRAKDFLIITHSNKHDWRELDPSQFIKIIE